LVILFARPLAAAIVVDGNLSDWGVTIADNNLSNYSGLLTSEIGLLGALIEDQNDNAGDSGFLGPNYGGQNYDAEFLGVALQGTTLYIAIATGQRPDNGFSRYSPGDVYILVAGGGTYGIEVGGGPGGGAGGAISQGADGSFYSLTSGGFTSGHTALANRRAGSIWRDPTWFMDPINPPAPTQMVAANTGTHVGDVSAYRYTRNEFTTQHAVIELSLDVGLLGGISNLNTSEWRAACGNDELAIILPAQVSVPQPNPLGLVGVALAGLAFVGRRKGHLNRRP
jgi:hypothetical protein